MNIVKSLAIIACISMATPAVADPILAPPLNTQIVGGGTLAVTVISTQTVCIFSLTGRITQMGTSTTPGEITFTSVPAIGAGCGYGGIMPIGPIKLKTTSPTSWTFSQFKINHPYGQCDFANTTADYYNTPKKIIVNASSGMCTNLAIDVGLNLNVYF